MWVARVPVAYIVIIGKSTNNVAPHVGGASARNSPRLHQTVQIRSHPMWVARVPVQMHVSRRASVPLSHPMWVARVPVVNSFFVAIKNASSHPMWVARVPVARSNKFCGVRSLSHPMWVARVPVSRQRQYNTSLYRRTPCGWRECPFATPRSNVNI